MTDGGVTVDAIRCLAARRLVPEDIVYQVMVTVDAVGLKDPQTNGPEANRLREGLQSEALGVPETVLSLDEIFRNERMRNMAVITGRHGMMAGFLPAIVLVTHDVTVNARLGVVTQVGKALGIVDRIPPHAEGNTHEDTYHQSGRAQAETSSLPNHDVVLALRDH